LIIFTDRGKKVFIAAILLSLLAVLFRDAIIALFALALLSAIAFSALDAIRKSSHKVNFIPLKKVYRAVAGEEFRIAFRVERLENAKDYSFSIPNIKELKYESLHEDILVFEAKIHQASFKIIFLMQYEVKTRFNIFIARSMHNFDEIQIIVYPRFIIPLTKLSGYEIIETFGEGSSFRLSSVGEYNSTRDYYPGDELRHIDWRATARHQSLKVKEFSSPFLAKVNLVFDTTATDEISADLLATEFFNTLLALADTGTAISASLYDGAQFSEVNAKNAVEEIAEASLKMLGRFFPDIGRILDLPFSSDHKRDYFSEQNIPSKGSAIIITQLLSNLIDKLLIVNQVSDDALLQKTVGIASVVQPTQPWLTIISIEDAYIAKKEIERKVASLRSMGIKVINAT